jgi:hypothetical protein
MAQFLHRADAGVGGMRLLNTPSTASAVPIMTTQRYFGRRADTLYALV